MAQVVIEFGAPALGPIMDAMLSLIGTPTAIETELLSGGRGTCPPAKDACEALCRKLTEGEMERRHFLAASSALFAQRVLGANDKARGGLIGSGGRGRYLTAQFKEIGVEMAAVCDICEGNLNEGLKAASTGAKAHENYKKLRPILDVADEVLERVNSDFARRFRPAPRNSVPSRTRETAQPPPLSPSTSS